MKRFSSIFVAPIALILSVPSLVNAQDSNRDSVLHRINLEWLRIFEVIEEEYYKPVDYTRCYEAVQRSGLSGCLDRFSAYFSPSDWREELRSMNGRFSGVGMIASRRGNSIHLFPYPGTPAARAGILPGDILLMVDTVDVRSRYEIDDAYISRVLRLIRGDSGTVVRLVVERRGRRLPPITIQRAPIVIPSVYYRLILPRVGYIRVTQFSDHVFYDFVSALDSLRRQGAERFIFDVRNNPGGFLGEALNMLGLFARDSLQVMVTQEYLGGRRNEIAVQGAGPLSGIRAVVLVNEFSASAAEIFAGVLQDWGVAELVGRSTFGKGIGQAIVPLWTLPNGRPRPDSPVLMLTHFQYLIGTRRTAISEGSGLRPDHEVSDSLSSLESAQLQIEIRNANPTELYISPRFDRQLRRAIRLLRRY